MWVFIGCLVSQSSIIKSVLLINARGSGRVFLKLNLIGKCECSTKASTSIWRDSSTRRGTTTWRIRQVHAGEAGLVRHSADRGESRRRNVTRSGTNGMVSLILCWGHCFRPILGEGHLFYVPIDGSLVNSKYSHEQTKKTKLFPVVKNRFPAHSTHPPTSLHRQSLYQSHKEETDLEIRKGAAIIT